MDQRTHDLEWVSSVRSARRDAVERVQSGKESFAQLLRELRHDSHAGRTYVVALTDVHQCLGKVAGRRLMASLGIAPLTCVSDISDDQITALSQCCE